MTKKVTSFAVLALGLWTGMGLHAQNTNVLAGAAIPQVLTIPHKAFISGTAVVNPNGDRSNGVVDLMLRLYAAQTGGSPLFVEHQAVPVQNGVYLAFIGAATAGGIPPAIYNAHGTFWIEAVPASGASTNVVRTPFTLRRDASTPGTDAITLTFAVDNSVCFTCGGTWPVFSGMITSAGHATERSSACGGSLVYSADSSPYICSR